MTEAQGVPTHLSPEVLKALLDAKLISKPAYLQVAFAMTYGPLSVPTLTEEQTAEFARQWTFSDEPAGTITPSDMRKAFDKLENCLASAEEQKYPALEF